jgi:large subunit ribosomal protein L25
MLALEVKARDDKSSSEALRAEGVIPAVLYGPKEVAASISIDARRLESIWREAGETTVITLKGVGGDKDTLIHDVQVHPVTGKILHADFYVLEKGKKIEIAVPLEFTGEAPAEKLGHILVKALHEIEIEVAPSELPHSLEVDISKLTEVGDHITAAEIKLPASATLVTHAEEIIASVTAFQEEKAEEIVTEAVPATEVATEAEASDENKENK